jgi:RNA polymerase sigma factor (sigma-70 family)
MVRQLSASDTKQDFDELFCALLPRLYRRAVALAGDRHCAEDALHEAYLKLARKPGRLVGHPEPYAYAFVTVHNLIRDMARSRRRTMLVETPPEVPDTGGIPLREAELETTRLLSHLSVKQSAVVLLVDVDGLTLDQAAEVLGLHRGTVSRTRARALDKLRDLFVESDRSGHGFG